MAKIVLNMGTKAGQNITIISDEPTMEGAIEGIKEAIRAFDGTSIEEDALYKILKIEK